MSEILTCMDAKDRAFFTQLVSSAAMREFGGSTESLTHYLQTTGMLRSDADRIASCEAFGLEDDGAAKDVTQSAASTKQSHLDAADHKVGEAYGEVDRELDGLQEDLHNHKGAKPLHIAAGLAAATTVFNIVYDAIKTAKLKKASFDVIRDLSRDKSKAMAELRKAKAAGAVPEAGLQSEVAQCTKYIGDLKAKIRGSHSLLSTIKSTPKMASVQMAVAFAIQMLVFWVLTKVVLKVVRVARNHLKGSSEGAE